MGEDGRDDDDDDDGLSTTLFASRERQRRALFGFVFFFVSLFFFLRESHALPSPLRRQKMMMGNAFVGGRVINYTHRA